MHIKIQMRTKKLILQGAGDEKKINLFLAILAFDTCSYKIIMKKIHKKKMFFDDLGGKQNKSGKSAVAWDIIGGKGKLKRPEPSEIR